MTDTQTLKQGQKIIQFGGRSDRPAGTFNGYLGDGFVSINYDNGQGAHRVREQWVMDYNDYFSIWNDTGKAPEPEGKF